MPGVLTVLSCPPPLCPHVEFAVAAALGLPAALEWSNQPARPGMAFAALEWRAEGGAASRLASRLKALGLGRLRGGRGTGERMRRRALLLHA